MSFKSFYNRLLEAGKSGPWGLQPSRGKTSKIVEVYIKVVLWKDEQMIAFKVGDKEVKAALQWFESLSKEEQAKALKAANIDLADIDGAKLLDGEG